MLLALPSTGYGSTNVGVVVTVVELTRVPTQGLLTVRLTKDPRLRLRFDAAQTVVNGRHVQNSVWRVDESQSGYYTLTRSQRIEANGVLSVGFTGQLIPGATKGVLSVSTTLVGNSGGEVNVINNTDAEKIDYFPQ